MGQQNVSGHICKAWAAPEAKQARPFEIIIPTNPKLASGWGQKLGPHVQIQVPWVPKWAHGPLLSPVWPPLTLMGP